jgi:hypothetical protein
LWIWVSWQGAILSYFYLLSLHWEPRGATRSFTTTWWLHIMVNHFFSRGKPPKKRSFIEPPSNGFPIWEIRQIVSKSIRSL